MSLSKEDINASLADLDQSLAEIDSILKPILSKPLAETTKDMGPLENAQLQVTLAYTLNTLFYLYMKLQNSNMQGQQIVKDMDRLKEYMKKVKAAEQGLSTGKEDSPSVRLNKAAAKRFISSALANNPIKTEEEETAKEAEEEEQTVEE